MKYMKLFESKEDDEIIDAFKMCFQELIDKGFKVDIRKYNRSLVDFSKEQIVSRSKVKFLDRIPCFDIFIYKNSKQFNIKDIKDDLLTAESYMKEEFKLNLNQIYMLSNYYKGTEYLPTNVNIYSISVFFFTKN